MTPSRILIAVFLTGTVALSAACRSGIKLDENTDKGVPVESRAGATTGEAGASSQSARSAQQAALSKGNDQPYALDGPLSRRSIYFDFDSFVVKDEFRPVIEAHARYLIANPSRKVVIQGNTDERGSREYNLALGQKRAEATRKALGALGVADAQMEAVSFGEEKPKATGNDDAALAENRRADLAYQ
jgi:peptidoglycan-associated lipoprotein